MPLSTVEVAGENSLIETDLMITLVIIFIMTLLFVTNILRADLVSLLTLLALVLTGVITVNEALAGFSNSVVIMIAGLFVVGAGIFKTGLAQMAGNLLLRWANNSERKLFFLLMLIVAVLSAFLSNTGTVAILLPVVVSLALGMKQSPAKFLIPLAYMTSLGALLTLIATPPNLIVSQALIDSGYEGLSFFQITPIGIVSVLTGMIYLYLVRNILLPSGGKGKQANQEAAISPLELARQYQLQVNIHRVQVPEHSSLVNQRLADVKLPANYQLYVLQIEGKAREGRTILPITYQEMAGPASVIKANDILYLQGTKEQVDKFVQDYDLNWSPSEGQAEQLVSKQLGLAEVLLTPSSSLLNKTIADVGFREKYNLNIVGINRSGELILSNMSTKRLRFGDALLVQGSWEEIERLSRETRDVVVVGQPKEMASIAAASGKAPIAGAIMIFMLLLMTFEIVSSVTAVLVAAVLMVLTGCLRSVEDAYDGIRWESVILIGAMLPLGTALEKTGGMQLIADGIVNLLGGYGPFGILIGIYLVTMIIGQFISNTATAVLVAPIAITAAVNYGVSPYPFMIAVAASASMSFATPISTPTNAMVMTAGGYKFSDFLKIGIPMQLLMFVVLVIAIPIFFPF